MATSVAPPNAEGTGTYTYSSQPRTVQQRPKFRSQTEYSNIMYDRRIVRGNTYALHTLPASSQPDPLELQRQQESRRRSLAKKRAREQLKPRSPEPVEGRKHMEVQTELYLEEITDRVEEADVQTQTDAFLDRPPTPLFVPAKTGLDVSTQIEDGDLFDFNLEVKPILEVLVGKTVEQALLEVMEEEELASLRAQQRLFEENRNAEVVETQRLEEQERRRREEKERRMQQQREALLKEKETAEKIAARAFAQSYLSDLVPSVFSTLSEHGFFYDPIEREIETVFMPWLMDEAEKALEKKVLARAIVDVIVRDVVAKRLGISIPELTPPTPQHTESPATEAQATSQEDTGQTSNTATEQLDKVFGPKDDKEVIQEQQEEGESTQDSKLQEQPPVEPPSEQPPVEGNDPPKQPPVEGDDPPKDQPPVEGGDPPKDQPVEGGEQPPVEGGDPPKEQPPVEGGDPPKEQPPVEGGDPPKEQPPVEGGDPPKEQPPVEGGDPPTDQAAVDEPPTDNPPTAELPSVDQPPPADQPGDQETTGDQQETPEEQS